MIIILKCCNELGDADLPVRRTKRMVRGIVQGKRTVSIVLDELTSRVLDVVGDLSCHSTASRITSSKGRTSTRSSRLPKEVGVVLRSLVPPVAHLESNTRLMLARVRPNADDREQAFYKVHVLFKRALSVLPRVVLRVGRVDISVAVSSSRGATVWGL